MEKFPTYKELIELLNDAESVAESALSPAELVAEEFRQCYPHIYIGRPGRFLETIRRIAGPITNQRLNASSQRSYLKRQWKPRIRNTTDQCQGTQMYIISTCHNNITNFLISMHGACITG